MAEEDARAVLSATDVASLLDDRRDEGIFRVDRRAFVDDDVFDLEMQYIFEDSWVFLGLAGQVPRTHDFLTTWLGRTPVVIMRGADDRLRCFVNSCRHKRATLCHAGHGNARMHVCRYHRWAYDSSGQNRLVNAQEHGCYPAAFECENHDLEPVARFAEYRGVLFGSLNADVPPLDAHLGDARQVLDLVLDQSPDGIELVPGSVKFTFDANWKFQLENCSDGYHFAPTHASYVQLLEQRTKSLSNPSGSRPFWDAGTPSHRQQLLGTFGMANGHNLLWSAQAPIEKHPLFERQAELQARLGAARANLLFATRNFTLFPNVQFAENASSQLRVMRPLSAHRTEMRTWCFAPVGESKAARALRIRQYEDFFNPSGLATPDDTVAYEDCQQGYAARTMNWQQGYARGTTAITTEPDRFAAELGIQPLASVGGTAELCDETIMHTTYRAWHRLLVEGCSQRSAAPGVIR